MRMRPGRSVTRIRPSGRNCSAQGWTRPLATVSTRMALFGAAGALCCAAAAGPAASATKAASRRMAGSIPHPRLGPIAFVAPSAIYGVMGTLGNMTFRKMNGLANEIVVVDLRGSDRVLTEEEA